MIESTSWRRLLKIYSEVSPPVVAEDCSELDEDDDELSATEEVASEDELASLEAELDDDSALAEDADDSEDELASLEAELDDDSALEEDDDDSEDELASLEELELACPAEVSDEGWDELACSELSEL